VALAAIAVALVYWPLSIRVMHRYARSLIDLDLNAARRILNTDIVTDEPWKGDEHSGQTLIARYKRHTLRLMFDERGKATVVSIEVVATWSGDA
jgi:hypothetical protein